MSIWTCSNKQCLKQYNPVAAALLKGTCTCGQGLKNPEGMGWRFLNPEQKEAIKEAVKEKLTDVAGTQNPTPPESNPNKGEPNGKEGKDASKEVGKKEEGVVGGGKQ